MSNWVESLVPRKEMVKRCRVLLHPSNWLLKRSFNWSESARLLVSCWLCLLSFSSLQMDSHFDFWKVTILYLNLTVLYTFRDLSAIAGIRLRRKDATNENVMGGRHSTEVALALLTQLTRVRFSAFPRFFRIKKIRISWCCRDLSTGVCCLECVGSA